jgi:hypothetical protein
MYWFATNKIVHPQDREHKLTPANNAIMRNKGDERFGKRVRVSEVYRSWIIIGL